MRSLKGSTKDTSDDGYNYIFANSNNDTIYDLYNNTPDSIKAENNFWGTGNLSIIEQHIFHKPDNPSLGFVDYMPIYIPVSVISNGNTTPSGFKLYDIYPNPFNPSAVITYEVPAAVYVDLKVYDILGSEISLIDKGLKQAGKHEVNFNGAGLSSGVYFVVLVTDGFVDSRKLILLK